MFQNMHNRVHDYAYKIVHNLTIFIACLESTNTMCMRRPKRGKKKRTVHKKAELPVNGSAQYTYIWGAPQ
jgi:hypothetical protein